MNTEQQVAKHYTHGSLQQVILDALKQMARTLTASQRWIYRRPTSSI